MDHSCHRLISWDERAVEGAKRAGLEAAHCSFSVLDLSTGRTTRGVGVVCTANCSSCGRRRPTLHGAGSLIAVADHDSLHIWDSAKQQRVLRRPLPANIFQALQRTTILAQGEGAPRGPHPAALAVSPEGDQAAFAHGDASLAIWDLKGRTSHIALAPMQVSWLGQPTYSPDGRHIALLRDATTAT